MTGKDFIRNIRKSWGLVSRLHLGRSFSSPISLNVDEEFRDVALDDEAVYEQLYLVGLRRSHYNFILSDFSYFQFSLEENSIRCAYLPNPFRALDNLDADELESMVAEGTLSFDEYADLVAESLVTIKIPPIRYEFSPNQYREILHPCSHFHIGYQGENRWPVARKLTPLAFTLLIVRAYYPADWSTFEDHADEFFNRLNQEIVNERINCRKLDNTQFSQKERRLFHFV